MSPPPSTSPVKVPASAATYTPATLDPDLRSQINAALLREGHVERIQEQLLHSLHAHPSNWPSAVQSHALSLLRSGEVTTFPALVKRVVDDVRHDTQAKAAAADGAGKNGETTNGATNGKKAANGTAATEMGQLAVPTAVVDEVLKVTRESLEAVCDIDSGAT